MISKNISNRVCYEHTDIIQHNTFEFTSSYRLCCTSEPKMTNFTIQYIQNKRYYETILRNYDKHSYLGHEQEK